MNEDELKRIKILKTIAYEMLNITQQDIIHVVDYIKKCELIDR